VAQPFSVANYLSALLKLLPRGRAGAREAGSGISNTLTGFAAGFQRLDAAAIFLLQGAFPSTAINLLTEWEATLGLPDPCAGVAPTIQQRQNQVVARLSQAAGQSVGFFVGFAAKLGFVITITEFTGSTTLANTWQVNVPASGIVYFTADQSYPEDPVDQVSTNSLVLQCEFQRLKPAHTILNFNWI
jgi:uncharacterized protein YmfQ (DUF2313 family)